MACTSVAGLHRSDSGGDLRLGIRRSRSEPLLRRSVAVARAVAAPPKIKTSRSIPLFPFHFSGSILPNPLRSFLFDANDEEEEERPLIEDQHQHHQTPTAAEEEIGKEKRSNWVERLLELRGRWQDRQHRDADAATAAADDDDEALAEDYVCGVSYDSDEEQEEGGGDEWDRESFARVLNRVSLSDTRLFSQLAFLCNLAYVIPDIKAEDLSRYYDLQLVTSSLVRKAEAAAVTARLEADSIRPEPLRAAPGLGAQKKPFRPSVAYEIGASAAAYVHSRAKGLLSGLGARKVEEEDDEAEEDAPPLAAYVAASTMTAVVAAEEEARQQAAKDLRSLHSSPCEWFVCDEHSTCTRCFVIQGSDSLASWQANLFFEPTKFEGTEVLVHRGIYEAAKGIYEQFMPEIETHLLRYGARARFRFTGHSLGGSLALLVSLMLLARRDVPRYTVLPVVTFGSPSVFCGGHRVLTELGLDEDHVRSVMMHRDIVPRAFSCNYPNHVAQVLKRLNSAFRSHPCLNNEKLLYSPLGQLYILQPDEKSSLPHPLLPPGAALYALERRGSASAVKAFLNTPHPLETLSDPTAYGSEGTILRDHESSNYLKAVNGLLRQHSRMVVKNSRKKRKNQLWPLLTSTGGMFEKQAMATKEMVTGV